MEHRMRNGERRRAGFTLIELMIVMTIVVILVSIAVPLYQKSIVRAKESVLRNNLFTMRTVIDEYTYDKQKAPQSLQDLVSEGYLRDVPIDPMTGYNTDLEDHHGGRHEERQPDRAGHLRRAQRLGQDQPRRHALQRVVIGAQERRRRISVRRHVIGERLFFR